jgi:hypothetical protein
VIISRFVLVGVRQFVRVGVLPEIDEIRFLRDEGGKDAFSVGILNEVFEGQTQEYDRKFDDFVDSERV